MTQIRAARMAEMLREQISDILQHHLSDPRLSWISVVKVDLSSDMSHAKVFISVLGDENAQEASLRVLHRARSAVRAELAHRIRVRKVPEIAFHADRSIEYGVRIQGILRELGFDADRSRGGPRPDDEEQQ
jgi:ribosome-binding factor A